MSAPLQVPPDIAHLTAPLLIGALLNYALYGALGVQVYIYHLTFPNDKRIIKTLVYGVFLIETVQVCLCAADIYYWFGSGYGNMLHVGNVYLSPFDTPLLGSLVSFSVQIFFCYRIWNLRNDYLYLSIFISCISITQLYGGIAGSIRGYLNRDFSSAHIHVEDAYLWLVGNAAADLIIAVTMSYLLLKLRRKEHRFTNDVIMRLVRLIMETNSLTAGIALLSVILFVSIPNTNYFICPTLVIGKLYSNTLLVTFNNRIFIAHSNPDHGSSDSSVPSARARSNRRSVMLISNETDNEMYKIKALESAGGDDVFHMEHMQPATSTSSTNPTAV